MTGFKQIADRHGITERVSDAITGHAPATAGRGYGAPTLEDMANALKTFPRYAIEQTQSRGTDDPLGGTKSKQEDARA